MDKCRALTKTSICGNKLSKAEVKKGGFCKECWTPGIVDDYQIYEDARAAEYSKTQAANMAGIIFKDATPDIPIGKIVEMKRKTISGGGDYTTRRLDNALKNAKVDWKLK